MIASIASSAAMMSNVFIGTPMAERAYISFLVEVLTQGLTEEVMLYRSFLQFLIYGASH